MPATALKKFEGPLDLLLQLIEREELVVTEIALSNVTEQFLAKLREVEEKEPESLASFLVVATKLVYLKSKELLPYLAPAEEEGPSLADQLKLYKLYADAAKQIERIWNEENAAYGRIEPPLKVEGFVMPANAESLDLQGTFLQLLKRWQPTNPLPKVTIDHSVSVRQRIESIYAAVQKLRQLHFTDLTKQAHTKTDIIVSFLALLELFKQDKICIQQLSTFADMHIHSAR